MGGIILKTIFYGQNTLKMANSRYGGYNTQNNPLWKSENSKLQIYQKIYLMDATLRKWQIDIWEV